MRDVADDAKIVREEQFGPVLPVLKYSDVDDVIARANDSEYGLAGSVWGTDVDRAIAVAMRIDTGTVWVNQHLAIDATIPFRGSKQSGWVPSSARMDCTNIRRPGSSTSPPDGSVRAKRAPKRWPDSLSPAGLAGRGVG